MKEEKKTTRYKRKEETNTTNKQNTNTFYSSIRNKKETFENGTRNKNTRERKHKCDRVALEQTSQREERRETKIENIDYFTVMQTDTKKTNKNLYTHIYKIKIVKGEKKANR